jgi:twitching motility protein PilT
MSETDLVGLLTIAVNQGASDLHLTVDAPPLAPLHGDLTPLNGTPVGLNVCRDMIFSVLTESQRSRLEQEWELISPYRLGGRPISGNAHYCRGGLRRPFGTFRPIFLNCPSWGMAA